MTMKEAFAKLSVLLTNQNFENAKTVDGLIIQWEGELSQGTALMTVDSDGNMMPTVDGTITMEDGTMVTVVGGLVTEVKMAESEVEVEVETEDMGDKIEKMFAQFSEEFTSIKSE
jgi:hypothetical protein